MVCRFFPLCSAITISQGKEQILENPERNCSFPFQTSVPHFPPPTLFLFLINFPFLIEVEEPKQLSFYIKCCPPLARKESSLIKSDIPGSLQLERIKVQREQPEDLLLQRGQRLLIITKRNKYSNSISFLLSLGCKRVENTTHLPKK